MRYNSTEPCIFRNKKKLFIYKVLRWTMIAYWARRLEGAERAMNFEWTKMISLVIISKLENDLPKSLLLDLSKCFQDMKLYCLLKGTFYCWFCQATKFNLLFHILCDPKSKLIFKSYYSVEMVKIFCFVVGKTFLRLSIFKPFLFQQKE